MAVSPAEHHRQVAERFTECVNRVGSGEWDGPTPVAEWAVRDIIRHLVEWFPAFLASGSGVRLPPAPSVDEDPAACWIVHSEAVQALLNDPATATMILANPHIGEVPVPEAVDRFYTPDVFMHTWDLARATGQDTTLDAATCAAMLEGMRPIEQMLRASGQYGPRVDVADDVPIHDQLAAFIGRDPSWTPPPATG